LTDLVARGADVDMFIKAHTISVRATKGRKFNLTYLAKAVDSLLDKSNDHSAKNYSYPTNENLKTSVHNTNEYVYEENLENARSWAGDLI